MAPRAMGLGVGQLSARRHDGARIGPRDRLDQRVPPRVQGLPDPVRGDRRPDRHRRPAGDVADWRAVRCGATSTCSSRALRIILFVMLPITALGMVLRSPSVTLLVNYGRLDAGRSTSPRRRHSFCSSCPAVRVAHRDPCPRVLRRPRHDDPGHRGVLAVAINVSVAIVAVRALGLPGLPARGSARARVETGSSCSRSSAGSVVLASVLLRAGVRPRFRRARGVGCVVRRRALGRQRARSGPGAPARGPPFRRARAVAVGLALAVAYAAAILGHAVRTGRSSGWCGPRLSPRPEPIVTPSTDEDRVRRRQPARDAPPDQRVGGREGRERGGPSSSPRLPVRPIGAQILLRRPRPMLWTFDTPARRRGPILSDGRSAALADRHLGGAAGRPLARPPTCASTPKSSSTAPTTPTARPARRSSKPAVGPAPPVQPGR